MHIFHNWDVWKEFKDDTGWVTQYRKCKICGYRQTWTLRLIKIIVLSLITSSLFLYLCELMISVIR